MRPKIPFPLVIYASSSRVEKSTSPSSLTPQQSTVNSICDSQVKMSKMNIDITASAKPEYPVLDRDPPFTKIYTI
ncbi:hypothetical protein CFP56_021994 [Quercus suber]|uniref:Uncharacterized protein n=1 Tax=Quercus suber TaxID=58331 RepID=A0AAW0KDB9_QUESU